MNSRSPTSPVASATQATLPNGGGPSSDFSSWDNILNSVTGNRGVVTKNVILLGGPKSGKSTLLSRLASPTGEVLNLDDETAAGPSGATDLDLGLSYNSFDVGDEADEETVARLGVYQLASSTPPYPALLPLALSKSTLLDSLAIIVLDWERPWRFLKDIQSWMGVLEGVLKIKGVAEGWEGAEARERLEAHLRHYYEPPATNSASTGPSASQLADTDAPLPPGVLTDNPGLPIVFVCTKADQINSLERDKDFKEEQYDYVQQNLRAIALKYGAALFFTAHTRPISFAKLRSYILHRLFSQPITAPQGGAAPAVNSTSRYFPFPYRANVVDRDQVLVPTGWDSWGKIRILRDRFDADGVGKGWELDMEHEMSGVQGMADGAEEEKFDSEGRRIISAIKMYEEVVMDMDGNDQPISMANSHVEAQDEQDFLKTHYETLQKDREKDPRAAFAARPGATGAPLESTTFNVSVVGPMASTALSLPSVERALERDPDDVTARLAKLARRELPTSSGVRSPNSQPFGSPSLSSSPPLNGTTSPNLTSALLSPSSSSSGVPGASGPAQNEVLANFFQSLLAARGTNGAARPGGVQSLAPSTSAGAGARPASAAGSTLMSASSRSNSQQK